MRMQLLAATLLLAACGQTGPAPAESALSASPPPEASTAASPAAGAQAVTAEQDAGLAVLKPLLDSELRQPVTLALKSWKASGDYAYVTAEATNAAGEPIDVAAAKGDEGEYDGALVEAVLLKVDGVWTVKDHVIGATDVWSLGQCGTVPADLIVCE